MTIEIQDLEKTYGGPYRLRIPFLSVETGETFGLVGNNGAGKTTLLRLMLDLMRRTAGSVRLDGEDVAGRLDWRKYTGSYIDSGSLLDFLTPDEYFLFVGSIYGMSEREVEEALGPYRSFFTDRVLGQRSRYIRDLSTGNAKKVGLVAAMFIQPRLLVLDEPFANLDPGSQIRLKLLMMQLNMSHGTTLFISSHDLVHVADMCERIGVLDEGQIVRETSTSQSTLEELELYFATRID